LSNLAEGLEALRQEQLIAYPTETIWGLGACARSAAGLERLRVFKGRRQLPVALLVDGIEAVLALGAELTPAARRLAEAHWPGPLTLVVPCPPNLFAPGVARDDGAVGFRCSPHPVAARLAAAARRAGVGPLTATSLNHTGEPPARTRDEALAVCGDAVRVVFGPGPDAGGGAPSSVVDCTGTEPVLLREAALAAEVLGCRPPAEQEKSSA